MTIKTETSLASFEAWSGAESTMEKLYALDLCTELENALDELYPDGMTDTELNDILWFEEEWIAELVGYGICPDCGEWFPNDEKCECDDEDEEEEN